MQDVIVKKMLDYFEFDSAMGQDGVDTELVAQVIEETPECMYLIGMWMMNKNPASIDFKSLNMGISGVISAFVTELFEDALFDEFATDDMRERANALDDSF